MATEAEILDLFDFLKAIYPPNDKQVQYMDNLITIWSRAFADTPGVVLKRAVELYTEKGKWWPKPAEIHEQIKKANMQVAEETRQVNAAAIIDQLTARRCELERGLYNGETTPEDLRALAAEFKTVDFLFNEQWCNVAAERIEHDRSNADPIPAGIPATADIPF